MSAPDESTKPDPIAEWTAAKALVDERREQEKEAETTLSWARNARCDAVNKEERAWQAVLALREPTEKRR